MTAKARRRSAFFSGFRAIPDRFLEDLQVVSQLTASQRKKTLAGLDDIFAATTLAERTLALDKCVSRIGGEQAVALKVLTFISEIHGVWHVESDTASDVLQDMKDIGIVSESDAAAKRDVAFLKKVLLHIEQDSPRRRRKGTAESTVPDLVGVSAVTDYRVVLAKSFAWSTQSVQSYSPTIEGLVPVTVIQLEVKGMPSPVVFQCNEPGLAMLESTLKAARKELRAAEAFVGNLARGK